MQRVWAAGLAAGTVFAQATAARASACCGESHGLGERLSTTERAGITSSFRFRERFGAWSASGAYGALPDGDVDRELRADLGWLVRVSDDLQLGVSVPAIATWRTLAGHDASGAGIGDITALARWDLISVRGWKGLPGVALTFSATVPTGRGPQRAEDALAADVTGLGTAELRPGIAVEKTWDAGWFVTAIASVAFRTGYQARETEIDLAPRLSLVGIGGPTFESLGLSLGAGVLFETEGAPAIDGVTLDGSSRWRTALLVLGGYDLTQRWTLLASTTLDLPVSGLGQSESVGIAPAIGARFVWGDFD